MQLDKKTTTKPDKKTALDVRDSFTKVLVGWRGCRGFFRWSFLNGKSPMIQFLGGTRVPFSCLT